MPKDDLVVSDTSPVLNLALIDQLSLLKSQFSTIGVLLKAAKADRIELKQELDSLRAAGFWVSDDLYSKVLSEAGE